jgi:hypothetical protein
MKQASGWQSQPLMNPKAFGSWVKEQTFDE